MNTRFGMVLVTLAFGASGQDLDAIIDARSSALEAYEDGDYPRALAGFEALAVQGVKTVLPFRTVDYSVGCGGAGTAEFRGPA